MNQQNEHLSYQCCHTIAITLIIIYMGMCILNNLNFVCAGWIPLQKNLRQYCWHLASVDLDLSLCLVLTPGESSGELVIRCRPLSELCGKTCELIGTNINGNPYGGYLYQKLGTSRVTNDTLKKYLWLQIVQQLRRCYLDKGGQLGRWTDRQD